MTTSVLLAIFFIYAFPMFCTLCWAISELSERIARDKKAAEEGRNEHHHNYLTLGDVLMGSLLVIVPIVNAALGYALLLSFVMEKSHAIFNYRFVKPKKKD